MVTNLHSWLSSTIEDTHQKNTGGLTEVLTKWRLTDPPNITCQRRKKRRRSINNGVQRWLQMTPKKCAGVAEALRMTGHVSSNSGVDKRVRDGLLLSAEYQRNFYGSKVTNFSFAAVCKLLEGLGVLQVFSVAYGAGRNGIIGGPAVDCRNKPD
jgi:hypothetical protein